jgi:hypothetical protein
MGFPEGLDTPVYEDNTTCIEWGNHVIGGRERAVATCILYCTQPTPREVTKLLCPHHEGAGAPHPIRAGGPDLWYQMALVDTTVEQSLISSAGWDEGVRDVWLVGKVGWGGVGWGGCAAQ